MNVLALNGSGRPFGNNYNILKICLESFNKNNNVTELIQLNNLRIEGCKSCYSCKNNGSHCVIEDDMNHLYKKVMESDLLILSSPVYMWQISAQTKLFIERLYPFYHFDKPSELKGKKLILIFTQASPNKKLFEAYFEHIKASMIFLGFDIIEVVMIPGLRNADDYINSPDILDRVKDFGNEIW